jgi:hypothetical protein
MFRSYIIYIIELNITIMILLFVIHVPFQMETNYFKFLFVKLVLYRIIIYKSTRIIAFYFSSDILTILLQRYTETLYTSITLQCITQF